MNRRRLLIGVAVALIAASTCAAVTASPNGARTAAVGAASLTTVATPGSDATIQSTTFTVPPDKSGIVNATATCPSGTRVVGGGVAPTDSSKPLVPGFVVQSGPVDETGDPAATKTGDVARSWLASLRNPTGEPIKTRIFAICSPSSDATIVAAQVTEELSQQPASATCPAGTRAIGGGVGATGTIVANDYNVGLSGPVNETGETALTQSGDVARSWRVAVDDRTPYRVFALCSAGSDATIETKLLFVRIGPTPTRAIVRCPAGKRALGGGVGATTPGLSWSAVSSPLDESGETEKTESGDVARSWSASFNSITSDRNFRVFAICTSDEAKPKPTAEVRCAGKSATIVGTAGPDTLRGTAGPDVIAGLAGNDTISGLAGNDTICGGAGNDAISGGPGNDTLLGGPGVDRLTGGAGHNTVKP